MTLAECAERIGHAVAYVPHLCAATEFGIITEVRGEYVFVRYGLDAGAKATRPEQLRLALPAIEFER